jgi:hypothetical protein
MAGGTGHLLGVNDITFKKGLDIIKSLFYAAM